MRSLGLRLGALGIARAASAPLSPTIDLKAGVDGQIVLPGKLLANGSSPSAGDLYMVPVHGGDTIDPSVSKVAYAPKKAGEWPIWGARRVENFWPAVTFLDGGTVVNATGHTVSGASVSLAGASSYYYRRVNRTTAVGERMACRLLVSAEAPCVTGLRISGQYGNLQSVSRLASLTPEPQWFSISTIIGFVEAGPMISFEVGLDNRSAVVGAGSTAFGIAITVHKVQVEFVPDITQSVASEYLDPTQNYGFGANGVRYFTHKCGNAVDGNGVLTEAAGAAIPDIQGFRPQPATTNKIRYSKATGSTSGVLGSGGVLPSGWAQLYADNGISLTIVGSGQQDGLPYVDIRLSGTKTTGQPQTAIFPELSSYAVAASGQTWTGSFFVALIAGSLTNITNLQIETLGRKDDATGTSDSAYTIFTPTSTLARYSAARVMADALTTRASTSLRVYYPLNVPIDLTLRIAVPQLEQLPFPTSPILTGGADGSRLTDLSLVGSVEVGTEVTVYADVDVPADSIPSERIIGTDGTNSPALMYFTSGLQFGIWNGTESRHMTAGVSLGRHRGIVRVRNQLAEVFVDGVKIASIVNGAAPFTPLTGSRLLAIGNHTSGSYYAGPITIRGVKLWPRHALNDAQCERLTLETVPAAEIDGDFASELRLPSQLLANGSSPSSGDQYLVPVYGGTSKTVYRSKKAGEWPIWGARRVENFCLDPNPANWSKWQSGSGLLPTITANYAAGPDGLMTAARAELSQGGGVGSSWVYYNAVSTTWAGKAGCRIWLKSADGNTYIIGLVPYYSRVGSFEVGPEWRCYGVVQSFSASANAIRVGIGLGSGASPTADILIATTGDYGPMCEDLSGMDQTGPSEFVAAGQNYGFGANGVRYFPYACGNSVDAGYVLTEARGAAIPDVQGFRPQPASTNKVRNNRMAGAVAGSPGTLPTNWVLGSLSGVSTEILGAGVQDGLPYIDIRYSGTPSATSNVTILFDASTHAVAATGQTWAASAFVSLLAGSLANVTQIHVSVDERSSAGTYLSNSGTAFVPTGTLQRYTKAHTLIQATAGRVTGSLRVDLTNGLAVDFTLRIAAPQLEQLAFASSPILTSSADGARLEDVPSLGNVDTGRDFTLFVETTLAGASDYTQLISLDDGSTNNRISLAYGAGSIATVARGLTMTGGVAAATEQQQAISPSTGRARIIYRHRNGSYALFLNGTKYEVSGTVHAARTLIAHIGARSEASGQSHTRTPITASRIWPSRALNDETCKRLTQ